MEDTRQNKQTGSSATVVNSILQAASELIAGLGYVGSTTNRIAERAGVSIGSLYYYFRDKDAICRRLADQVIAEYLSRLESRFHDKEATEGLTNALIAESVEFTFDNRELLRKLFRHSARLGKLETVFEQRNAFASRLASRAGLPDREIHVLVNAINGVLDSHIYGTSSALTREETIESLLSLARAWLDACRSVKHQGFAG